MESNVLCLTMCSAREHVRMHSFHSGKLLFHWKSVINLVFSEFISSTTLYFILTSILDFYSLSHLYGPQHGFSYLRGFLQRVINTKAMKRKHELKWRISPLPLSLRGDTFETLLRIQTIIKEIICWSFDKPEMESKELFYLFGKTIKLSKLLGRNLFDKRALMRFFFRSIPTFFLRVFWVHLLAPISGAIGKRYTGSN